MLRVFSDARRKSATYPARVSGLKGGVLTSGACLIALAIAAPTAFADTTRAEWVAQVDPICQNGQAQETTAAQPLKAITRQYKKHPKSHKIEKRLLHTFSGFVQQSGAIERAVNAQIAMIPPATEDVSLVAVWLRVRGQIVDSETRLFGGGFKPKKGLKGFSQFFNDLLSLGAREYEAADLVRDFGFAYCNQAATELQFIG
jgi:hypothetical protein